MPKLISAGGKRQGRGTVRSETVTVRLDPKLRYLADLASRKQRRTLSSFIEWAIEDSFERVTIAEEYSQSGNQYQVTIKSAQDELWDVEEADRFARLALRYPDLLTHHEQIMWKLLRDYGYFWKGHFDSRTNDWTWKLDDSSLCWERLREYWSVLNEIARGTMDRSKLPRYDRKRPAPEPESGPDADESSPDDEDIPF